MSKPHFRATNAILPPSSTLCGAFFSSVFGCFGTLLPLALLRRWLAVFVWTFGFLDVWTFFSVSALPLSPFYFLLSTFCFLLSAFPVALLPGRPTVAEFL